MSGWRAGTIFVGVIVAALVAVPGGVGSMPASDVESSDVAIFYYPWFSTPARDGVWAHWYTKGGNGAQVLSTRYYPERGLYSSSDPSVVQAQMREIAAAGVSTVIVSWWGEGSPEDSRLPLVEAEARHFGLRVAVHLEPYPGRTPESVAADITRLEKTGVSDFYVYDIAGDAAAQWARALGVLSGVRVFGQTYLVGRARAAGFDGVYTYDVGSRSGGMFARLCAEAHAAGLLCAPSVGPGYDARIATGVQRVQARLGGITYERMWGAAIRARADAVTITSFNEWQEGTQIEPARPQSGRRGYGGAWGRHGVAAENAYLDATRRWAARYRWVVAHSGG
jgi:glycoprotein endo-alpha-1,2-mannosidase